MRVAAIIFAGLALAAIGILAVGFFMPGTWSAEQTREVAAPPERVYEAVAGAEGWARWAPWPEEGEAFEGPAIGTGSARVWDDPQWGSGRFEITDVTPAERVDYRVELEEAGYQVDGALHLQEVDGGTRLRWTEAGDFGRNPILSFTARRMEDAQGEQMARALEELARLVEEGRD